VSDGKVVSRRTVSELSNLDDLLGKDTAKARVAIEACREAWHVHAVLSELGHEVVLVDTTRVKQLGIGQHGRKTDRIDAEVLARALEQGRLPVAHVLSPARQQLRRHLGVRRALIETRAQYVVTIRGILRADGVRLPRCDTSNFAKHARSARLSESQRATIEPLVCLLESINEKLEKVDAQLEALCAKEPIITALTTVPGVGRIVAAAFVSVIDEAKRFHSAHQVESYLGLVPSEDSTGGKRKIGSITKQGNPYVRSLLVQSAWTILRQANRADPLRIWCAHLAKRRCQRLAIVALARRLAGILWAMWRDGTVYDAEWVGKHSHRGLALAAQSADFRAKAMASAVKKIESRRTKRLNSKRTAA
jgi:transposase